ncbi:hypothetical protein D3C87_1741520 [compost metagenome]
MVRRSGQKLHVRTEIVLSALAEFTLAAGNSRLQRDPVSHLQILHPGAQFNHCSGTFMPQNKIAFDNEVTDPAMLQIVDIGTANADILQFDNNLTLFGLGHADFIHFQFLQIRHIKSSVLHKIFLLGDNSA